MCKLSLSFINIYAQRRCPTLAPFVCIKATLVMKVKVTDCINPNHSELRMSSTLTPTQLSEAHANLVIILDKSPRPSSFVYQSALDVSIPPDVLKCATSAVEVSLVF